MSKVILILVDGMRPDALLGCGSPYGHELLKKGSYTLAAETVYPSMTLPCHMSLFHSVSPDRHGVTTNTYTPQARPVNGLCEQLRLAGKKSCFFYNWEELRDLSRPSSLACSYYCSGEINGYERSNEMVTNQAIACIRDEAPDFAFIYLGLTDHVGHDHGWMGQEYLEACRFSLEEVRRIVEQFEGGYTILITADHGGHGRTHGTAEQEDMLIPFIGIGPEFEPGQTMERVGICDIAPTIAALTGVDRAPEWEGSLLTRRAFCPCSNDTQK